MARRPRHTRAWLRRSVAAAVLAAIAAAALAAAGCGGGGGEETTAAETGATATTGETGATAPTPGATVAVPPDAPEEASEFADEWPTPNGDLANTRVATGSSISSDNVDQLGVAWTVPITATGTFGGYASTPIIADGVVYTQDLNSNVQAIDLETGQVKWSREYNSPDVGPNGLTIGYGKVYGATSDFAFALDMETGDEVWRSQKLTRNANEGIDMAPAVYDETVYVSTVPGNTKSFYKGNGVGILWALDAETGEKKWTFDTVPQDLWDPKYKDINSGGGLWHPPAFDQDGNLFIDVANPAPWPGTDEHPWGSSRPGPNEHTNSVLKLDRSSGELQWANQILPHDVYDWDLQLPPVVTESNGTEIVLSAGKLGYVIATDAETGKTIWKTAVGQHNGHDRDNEKVIAGNPPELPLTVLPGILGGVETQLAVADGVVYAPVVNIPTRFQTQEKYELQLEKGTGEMVALDVATGKILWDTKFPQPAYGAATVSNDLVFTTTFDGKLIALDRQSGNVVWSTQMPAGTNATVAISGDTLVTAASYPLQKDQKPAIIAYRIGATGGGGATTGGATTGGATTGETGETSGGGDQQALGKEVFTANCGSCHTLADAGTSGNVGPNLDELQPDAGTVEEQVRNGGGGMPAFEGRLSDEQIKAVAAYVAAVANPNATGGGGGGGP
jgi:outer membrane protein assembly factor BamB